MISNKFTSKLSRPYHFILLTIFFVYSLVNDYYGLIKPSIALKYFFAYTALGLVMFLIGFLIFKSWCKSGMWAFILLVTFFFFGAFHDVLQRISILHRLTSYTFVLPILLVVLLLITILLRKYHRPIIRATVYLNSLMLIFLLVEIGRTTWKLANNQEQKNDWSYNNPEIDLPGNKSNQQKPDIFFIVFDEFASSVSLQKNLGFNNFALDSLLRSNGFYVASNSKSNYNSTPICIASTFNLQYFNRDVRHKEPTAKIGLQSWNTLANSLLPRYLQGLNYDIVNLSVSDLANVPAVTWTFATEESEKIFTINTLAGRIMRDLGWNLINIHIPFLSDYFVREIDKNADKWIGRNSTNYQLLMQELTKDGQQPKFVYAHLLLPRSPFYLDSNGKKRPDPVYTNETDAAKKQYIEQVKFSNKLVAEIIHRLNQPAKRDRVVVIEGDHGFRYPNADTMNVYFRNLSAIYFSDKNYQAMYDSISSVNSFRVVLNKYFGANLPLLKDSSILMK